MKSKALVLGAVVTAFTFASFATDALLSPRAQGNQNKVISSPVAAPATTVAYAAPGTALFSPRLQGNQIKVASGVASDSNPSLACRNGMAGSPKIVAECSQHTTMPGCVTVASMK